MDEEQKPWPVALGDLMLKFAVAIVGIIALILAIIFI